MHICDHCKHIDYQAAAASKMKYWGICKLGSEWEFLGRNSSCDRFQEADKETIEKRKHWLGQRG